ncbi:hypothetical protein HOLleu_42491 [Holothuria leucospilota]|uniref:Immunoglobulin domain-containing protein n=1 Tax=Holothuria leucospilota TaxID=206669 RepID=A0A9Q0YCY4_HOLLE|nr:hypothetical protein HOLleu_42491 [Holothuria leucospilota]
MCKKPLLLHLKLNIINIIFQFLLTGTYSTSTCYSPQYLELGKTGTVNCVFQEGFFGIYWYNTTDYMDNDPIIHYNNIKVIGAGYESGEFDVHPNGSLIIRNVTLRHERIFTVAYIRTKQELSRISEIQLIVFVKPEINFPQINVCGNTSHSCFSQNNLPLQCYVREVRPNVTLKWVTRQLNGDADIQSEMDTTLGHVGYTTRASVKDVFQYSPLLLLLVCKASGPPMVLQTYESMILYQRRAVDLSHTALISKYAERNTMIELRCTDDIVGFVVWKKVNSVNKKESEILLYAVFIGEQYTKKYVDNVSLNPSGSLEVTSVNQEHEGIYICIFGDGLADGWITYDVKVTVSPTPGYPVVDGCNHQHYCVLEVKREGSLTCKVMGIRPQIQLRWKTFHDSDVDLISFANQQLIVKDNGETFDVSLTATYYVIDTSRDRLTIECKEREPGHTFHLTTKLDLIFTDFNPIEEVGPSAAPSKLGLIIPVIGVTIFLLIVVGIFTIKYISRKKKQHSKTIPESNDEVGLIKWLISLQIFTLGHTYISLNNHSAHIKMLQ